MTDLVNRLKNLIGFGRSTLTDDSGDLQALQVTERATGADASDRITEKVFRFTEYGFSSVLPTDAEVLVLHGAGLRTQAIAIASGHRASRPKDLQVGDVIVYDQRGHKITFTEGGIEVDGAGGPVTVTNASKVRCECDLEVVGDIHATGDIVSRSEGQPVSLNGLHDAYNEHDHPPTAGSGTWGVGPPNPLAE